MNVFNLSKLLLLDLSLSVKAAPHECVIRTLTAEKEARFYSKVIVSSCTTTSVII